MTSQRHCICDAGPFLRDNNLNQHRAICPKVAEQREKASKNVSSKLKSRKSFFRPRQKTYPPRDQPPEETFGAECCIEDGSVPSYHLDSPPSPHSGATPEINNPNRTLVNFNESSGIAEKPNRRVSKPSRRQIESNEYMEREAALVKEPTALRPVDSRLPVAPQPLPTSVIAGHNNHEAHLHLRTEANLFGLVRIFPRYPTHDPEETLCRDDRGSVSKHSIDPLPETSNRDTLTFLPYPNENSFLLGEWFYNSSKQKSLDDFQKLRSIITRDGFRPEDIRKTNWKDMHNQLGHIHGDTLRVDKPPGRNISTEAREKFELSQSQSRWLKLDASWRRTSVSISLKFPLPSDNKFKKTVKKAKARKTHADVQPPFPMQDPTVSNLESGMFSYTFHDFYHRSIMEVIRDKVSNGHACRNFHFVPYQLRWQQAPQASSVAPDDVVTASNSTSRTSSSTNYGGSSSPFKSSYRNPLEAAPKTVEHDVFGEFYSSKSFMKAFAEVQAKPGPSVERVVVTLMFSSDVAHLTSFGDAEVWPLYMFFLNDSKYERAKPNENLCEQIAYFNKLPDSFKDFVYGIYSETECRHSSSATSKFFAHASKEFTQAQWKKLLSDPEFLHAYEHGKLFKSWDGIDRLFYPRAFVYSADYKEKVQIATIRSLGICPCPECLIKAEDIYYMGTAEDEAFRLTHPRVDSEERRKKVEKARVLVNKEGRNVDSKGVEDLLKDESLVPVENAFTILSKIDKNFNFFAMFLPDLLHEFLLGVWKAIFIHLLRLLVAIGGDALLAELDRRYRKMPTFGKDKIRKFTRNVSQLKAFAARDFEDLLQCSIPVFEGLIPDRYSANVMRFLYMLAYWYTLASLRTHIRPTVELLSQVTSEMAREGRKFSEEICEQFETRELESEARKRERRERKHEDQRRNEKEGGREKRKSNSEGGGPQKRTKLNDGSYDNGTLLGKSDVDPKPTPEKSKERKKRKFVLATYKWHRLGDYARAIEEYGTTDSYTTALGEHEHKKPKGYYTRTNKKDFIRQFVRMERRQARTRAIRQRHQPLRPASSRLDDLTTMDPSSAYHIAKYSSKALYLVTFLDTYKKDPAVTNFTKKLRLHLLPRVRAAHLDVALQSPHEYSQTQNIPLLHPGNMREEDNLRVFIEGDRLFPHPTVAINYTTYDVRRDQDIISPHTSHCNLMVLAKSESAHYWYAKLLGIYHVMVTYLGPGAVDRYARRFDVLWVRWYQSVNTPESWTSGQLESVSLGDENSTASFGFIDPRSVLRACHISPNFHQGTVSNCKSFIGYGSEEYKQYYILRFSDRDLAMRYEWGLAIGHIYSRSRKGYTRCGLTETDDMSSEPMPARASTTAQQSGNTMVRDWGEKDEGSNYVMGGYNSDDNNNSSGNGVEQTDTESEESDSEDDQDVIERLDIDDMYGT